MNIPKALSDPDVHRALDVVHHLKDGKPVYLVGGFVRDALIGRESHDIDLLVPPPALPLARRLADTLSGAFFPLDEARDVGRVVIRRPGGDLWVDVAAMRGSLEEDLRARDFTVNAIAMDIARWPDEVAIVDPLHGEEDIRARLLRAVAPDSFQGDPVRVLRMVRFASALGFAIEENTWNLAREAARLLTQVSSERIRDEIVNMAGYRGFAKSVVRMDELDVLPYTFPEMLELKGLEQSPPHVEDVFHHTLAVVEWLEVFLDCIYGVSCPEETEADREMAKFFRDYAGEFAARLDRSLVMGRSKKALLKLAALAHDWGKSETRSVGEDGRIHFFNHDLLGAEMVARRMRALAFGQKEVRWISGLVKLHMRIPLLGRSQKVTDRAIFRLVREAGDGLPDLILLSLADHRGTYGDTLILERWKSRLALVRRILDFYLSKLEGSLPKPLLSGRDLMEMWNVPPGPGMGELLDALAEAQAIGEVRSKEDAIEWMEKRLKGRQIEAG